jgi:hypothetical protein
MNEAEMIAAKWAQVKADMERFGIKVAGDFDVLTHIGLLAELCHGLLPDNRQLREHLQPHLDVVQGMVSILYGHTDLGQPVAPEVLRHVAGHLADAHGRLWEALDWAKVGG